MNEQLSIPTSSHSRISPLMSHKDPYSVSHEGSISHSLDSEGEDESPRSFAVEEPLIREPDVEVEARVVSSERRDSSSSNSSSDEEVQVVSSQQIEEEQATPDDSVDVEIEAAASISVRAGLT